MKILHGTIHGQTIQLDEDPGVADGQEVEVQVKVIPSPRTWGEGIRRSAGGWASNPEIDKIMEQIQRERAMERRSQVGDECFTQRPLTHPETFRTS